MSEGAGSHERPPLGDLDSLMVGGWDWPRPTVVESTPSTMAEIEERARAGAPEGTVVVAEQQTAGRGRRGRHWESPARAGLWWSLLLRPSTPVARQGWLPLVVGVAVARALRDSTGVDVRLKWPNDLVVENTSSGDRETHVVKLAGILAERLPDGAVVVGVGVNVDQSAQELPPGGASLRTLGATIERTPLLTSILEATARAYRAWEAGDDPEQDYAELSATLGRQVSVDVGGRIIRGSATGLGSSGELIVETVEGTRETLSAGDVTLLRPAD